MPPIPYLEIYGKIRIVVFHKIYVVGRGQAKNAILEQPDSGKTPPVSFEICDFPTSSDMFFQTIPNSSESVPKPLPDTSQYIPKLMKKLPRTDLGGAGNRTGDLPIPGPGTNPLGYSDLTKQLL